jgi:hypothetical protein
VNWFSLTTLVLSGRLESGRVAVTVCATGRMPALFLPQGIAGRPLSSSTMAVEFSSSHF